jgi:hypothetical protein
MVNGVPGDRGPWGVGEGKGVDVGSWILVTLGAATGVAV